LLEHIRLDSVSPSQLWASLDGETRELAARTLYDATGVAASGRAEADAAIAGAIRFRETAVRRLPVERRIGYLLKAVRPDDSLASSLLLALHLEKRAPMLGAFLDRLGIPNRNGLIEDAHELRPPEPDLLPDAVGELFERFPRDQVELYLASLIAIDPETWSSLVGELKEAAAD
jgi:hypothetical protein